MKEVLFIFFAYLIGSIPTAVWISRYFFGVDIRDYGSGNAGATNTFRVLGSKWGTIVMSVDVLKGVVATSLYIVLPFYMHNVWAYFFYAFTSPGLCLSVRYWPVLRLPY